MVVRPGEPPTSPARPHLVMQLRAGWRHVAPRRRFERGAEHFSPKGLPPRSRFLPLAPELAAKNEKGDHYVEVYGSGEELAPMCPATRLWQDKVQEIVLRLVGPECGVDGVYIDQIAASAPRLCFDLSHGHALGGGDWWTVEGYWPMLSSLQRRLPPGKMITSECNAESYSRWLDGLLTWHFQDQDQIF